MLFDLSFCRCYPGVTISQLKQQIFAEAFGKFFTCAWRRCSRWGELCLSLSNTLCISLALFFVLSLPIPKSALISQYSWLWLREELVNACPLGRDTRRTDGRRCNVGWQVAWLVWRRPDQDLTFFQLWFHRDWIAFFAIFTAGWGEAGYIYRRLRGGIALSGGDLHQVFFPLCNFTPV